MATQTHAPSLGSPSAPLTAARERRGFPTLKACAWSGPIFLIGLVLAFAVIAGYVPPPREHWTGGQIASWYRAHDARIKLGMEGMIVFACFYYFWSLAVARVMDHTEPRGSLLTKIQVFGGASTAWVTLITGIGFLLTAFRAGARHPADIQLLNDASFLVFNMTFMVTLVQQLACGIAWLQADPERSLIPRWVAYLCFWVPATYFCTLFIPFIQHGPFTWHGLITFYCTLSLFFVWMAVVSYYVIRAAREHPELEVAAE